MAGAGALTPLQVALAPTGGDSALDRQIASLQQRIAGATDQVPLLERLGRAFVAKARAESDAGCYELARQCALAIEQQAAGDPGALLLRGHVLHQEHRFAEAETVARQLVAARGTFLDQGLLGDVLFDLGRLDEARDCYQAMLDEKPCLQSYARAAQIRWRVGDLDGARELLDHAMRSGSSRDPEALAWVHADRARLELEAGLLDAAALAARAALDATADYPPALLVLARTHLARHDASEAVALLRRAAAQRPDPEYLWLLRDALIASGAVAEAGRVDADLRRTGARDDARTFAIYLASCPRGADDAREALRLAELELEQRQDVRTHDAHAWALFAAGRRDDAAAAARRAVGAGTTDPRLLLHAGAIARATGDPAAAKRWLSAADGRRMALLPCEQRTLDAELQAL